jgi:hypothetical protein
MKKLMIAAAAAGLAATTFAGLYGDTPDARHAWAVHDRNRPNPVKVTAEPGLPPSDAIILFDGSEKSFGNWCDKDGGPTKWKLVDGTLESVKRAGYIYTKQAFGDCQLHLEWATPKKVEGVGQGRGNSGVFLMGSYEVQVLDSYETDPSKDPNPNPNYADGQASAVYAENPPLVNASRKPGEWQTYDIVFHQPVWKDGKMVWPGSVTVFHNGVLTQDHWEMEGLTTHCKRRPLAPHATKLPLGLQDHGNPVHFRNIWIREIPSRYANTTHGGPAANEKDVMALRNKIAKQLFDKIDKSKSGAGEVNAILEVISYSKDEPFCGAARKICGDYRARLEKMDAAARQANKNDIISVKKSYDVLWRNGLLKDCQLGKLVNKIVDENGWLKKK